MSKTDLNFDKLERFSSRCVLDRAPDTVIEQAKLCILDTIGCMISGHQTAEVSMLVSSTPPHCQGPVPVIGSDICLDMMNAARVNGYAGDILELNDLIGGHASIGNVTAAIAAACDRNSSGKTLLESVIRGIEVTSKIYSRIYPTLKPFGQVGLVPVGLPSSVGAAAAVSHHMGLTPGQTQEAMSIAASLAGWCPAEVIFRQGGTVKPMLFGAQPAMTAIAAVQYALAGMTGPRRLLEGEFGYYATVSSSDGTPGDPLEAQWALTKPSRKLHACCGYIHAAVDAISLLSETVKGDLSDYDITIELPAYVHAAVSKQVLPATPNEARFDLRYCAALAVCGDTVILPAHSLMFPEYLERAQTRRALAKIKTRSNESLTHYQHCIVTARSDHCNKIHTLDFRTPRGGLDNAMSGSEVIEKFYRLVSHCMTAEQSKAYADRMMSLEKSESIGWIGKLARPSEKH